jgi:5-hydroxyisourate hydrolase-like protein (transthyretin family)
MVRLKPASCRECLQVFITSVLDTSVGKPAGGVGIQLQLEGDAGTFEIVATR